MAAEELNIAYSKTAYTEYAELNEVLNNFKATAESKKIKVTIKASELVRNYLGRRFCQIINELLLIAEENCIGIRRSDHRFIVFEGRIIQNQTLVRIQFSCENSFLHPYEERVPAIKESIEILGGYFKYYIEDQIGIIHLAFPFYK